MRVQGYDRDAQDNNGSKELGDLRNRKYISLVFHDCPDTYVSLVLLLA